ncbi:hypothetical protein BU14_0208s0028 [Porphyra umbilicalis]|uniref:Uncharacterized protein n=1 Tax=Porphyra umbilicalis TaxID=2786 RepID=A0A1X6P5Q1_PORUM|nr:hypothetical protein BU14_0208s0028 [Porphyra umbilicalis]|eukprot:OSX76070.1 hypothetical protein BU14_0208s0028 [Porphyra umbilicalis]
MTAESQVARRRPRGPTRMGETANGAATGTSGVRAGSTGEGECTSRLAAPAARRRHWHAGGCVGGGTWSPYAAAAAAVSRKARKGRYGGKGRTERPAAARVDSAVPPRGGPLTPARAGGGQHARGGATDGGGGGGRRRATGSGPARAPAREDSVGGAPPSRGIRCGHLRNGRAGAHTIIDARQGAGGTSSAAAGSAAALSRVAEASHGLRRGQRPARLSCAPSHPRRRPSAKRRSVAMPRRGAPPQSVAAAAAPTTRDAAATPCRRALSAAPPPPPSRWKTWRWRPHRLCPRRCLPLDHPRRRRRWASVAGGRERTTAAANGRGGAEHRAHGQGRPKRMPPSPRRPPPCSRRGLPAASATAAPRRGGGGGGGGGDGVHPCPLRRKPMATHRGARRRPQPPPAIAPPRRPRTGAPALAPLPQMVTPLPARARAARRPPLPPSTPPPHCFSVRLCPSRGTWWPRHGCSAASAVDCVVSVGPRRSGCEACPIFWSLWACAARAGGGRRSENHAQGRVSSGHARDRPPHVGHHRPTGEGASPGSRLCRRPPGSDPRPTTAAAHPQGPTASAAQGDHGTTEKPDATTHTSASDVRVGVARAAGTPRRHASTPSAAGPRPRAAAGRRGCPLLPPPALARRPPPRVAAAGRHGAAAGKPQRPRGAAAASVGATGCRGGGGGARAAAAGGGGGARRRGVPPRRGH